MERPARQNVIQDKSFAFAVQIVRLAKELREDHREFTLSDQLVRAGTSIGANVEEALGGQSRKDFLAKLGIAAKETRETHYWLRLVKESGLLTGRQVDILLVECREILAVLNSIILTTRRNANSEFRIHNSEFHRTK
jgi:four helix bundle protein